MSVERHRVVVNDEADGAEVWDPIPGIPLATFWAALRVKLRSPLPSTFTT